MKSMWKKGILTLLIALIFAMTIPSVLPNENSIGTVEAAKVKISAKKATLIKGQTKKLKIKGTSAKVKWKSSKKSVATVNKNGKVTAKKKGTAKITATVKGEKYTCKITVETPKISKTSATLTVGNSLTLKMKGTKQSVTWSSSKKSVATVSKKGVVKAKKAGSATITAKVNGKKYKCKITVKSKTVAVTGIKLNQSTMTLDMGSVEGLTATVSPSNATNQDVTWKSSDTKIATVDSGFVTGIAPGTATITASCGSYSAKCTVLVQQTYGDITGELTYKNGTADKTAFIVLIPADGSAKSLTGASDPLSAIYLNPTVYNEYGIYGMRTDTGSYTINNVPTGDYIVYLRSGNVSSSEWSSDKDAYYAKITDALSPYLADSVAAAFGETTGYFKYAIKNVTITKNKTITFSYDFGS